MTDIVIKIGVRNRKLCHRYARHSMLSVIDPTAGNGGVQGQLSPPSHVRYFPNAECGISYSVFANNNQAKKTWQTYAVRPMYLRLMWNYPTETQESVLKGGRGKSFHALGLISITVVASNAARPTGVQCQCLGTFLLTSDRYLRRYTY